MILFWKSQNFWKMIAGGLLPFELLTVHRSLPYRNSSWAGQQGRLHADTLDHGKLVSEDHRFLNVLGNYHNCFGEHIEVYRNGIEVWKWFWNFRVLSEPNFLKKSENDEIVFKISNFLENESGRGSCISSFPSGNQVDGSPLVAIVEMVAKKGNCNEISEFYRVLTFRKSWKMMRFLKDFKFPGNW